MQYNRPVQNQPNKIAESDSKKPETKNTVSLVSKLEKLFNYLLLATIIISPIIFWPSKYVALDLAKNFTITIGVSLSLLLFAWISFKKKSLELPPKSITWSVLLLLVSFILSALMGTNVSKSLFGQGFETSTVSFIFSMFASMVLVYYVVRNKPTRSIIIYTGLVISYLFIYAITLLRLVFGQNFLSLAVLSTKTSTLFGGWFALSSFALVISIIVLLAIRLLSPSKTIKLWYWIIVATSFSVLFIVNDSRVWGAAILIYLGMTVFMTFSKQLSSQSNTSWLGKISWVPLIACLVSVLFFFQGSAIANPIISKTGMQYYELSLPWQMTLDVSADTLKVHPVLGVGQNRFVQAFLANKPAGLNQTDAWQTEFNYGFGWIPSFLVTQGLLGLILWLLFLVFIGVCGAKTLKSLPKDSDPRFVLLSSFFSAVFLWIMAILSVPSHVLIFMAFVITGIWLGSAVAYNVLLPFDIIANTEKRNHKIIISIVSLLLIIISVCLAIFMLKKTIAISYFNSGIRALNEKNDPGLADNKFEKALMFDSSDVYWQARAEASLSKINSLVSSIPQNADASTTSGIANQVTSILVQAVSYSRKAIAIDPYNYYNHMSEARVLETANSLKMKDAYENAVQSYKNTILANPQNPYLYLSLARLYASQNKTDEALQAAGSAINLKNNYLDAVFFISQIQASKGNINDAITAAQVAIQINPNNPQSYFLLGLLYYNNKNYEQSAQALSAAVKLQPDYANARYFLGLSYARLSNIAQALDQFNELNKSNPNNQEISLIISNLKAGKSVFADAKPPITANPEKRSTLPIKERMNKNN